jgi:hypothetical protein
VSFLSAAVGETESACSLLVGRSSSDNEMESSYCVGSFFLASGDWSIIQCQNGIPIRPTYYSLVYFTCSLISLIIYVTPTLRTLRRPDDGFVGRNMSLASH